MYEEIEDVGKLEQVRFRQFDGWKGLNHIYKGDMKEVTKEGRGG